MQVGLIAEDEYDACNNFHNLLYGKRRTIEQWRWEFVSPLFGNPQLPFAVVRDNDRIVGTQALIPIRMIDKNGIYWTGKSEETLLDPTYRGKGFSEKMYQLVFDYALQNGLVCIWGFTRATKALNKSGFDVPTVTSQILFPFSSRAVSVLLRSHAAAHERDSTGSFKSACYRSACSLAQVLSAITFSYTGRRLPATGNLQVRTLDEPPEDAGRLCETFVRQWGGTTIYRDAAYLRWRVFDNPFVKAVIRAVYDREQLLGWVAYSLGDDRMGQLVDLILAIDRTKPYSSEDVTRLLLREAVIGTRNMGAVALRGWHVNDHPFDKMLTRVAGNSGFYLVKKGLAAVLHPIIKGSDPRPYGSFRNWYVTRIYTEGVFG